MTTLEDMCRAMDAAPQDLLAVGVTADLLDEVGDRRGPGMRVLWEIGKTGKVPNIALSRPGYYGSWQFFVKTPAYVGPYRYSSVTRGDTEPAWSDCCTLDDEWATLTDRLFWHTMLFQVPANEAVLEMMAQTHTLSMARLAAAAAWAGAKPTARMRWLGNMSMSMPKDADALAASEAYMEEFAGEIGSTVRELMAHAEGYEEGGEYWSEGGRFKSVSVPDAFWSHYQFLTGKDVRHSGSFFSCAC